VSTEIINCTPAWQHHVSGAGPKCIRVRSIMTTAATIGITAGDRYASPLKPLVKLSLRLRERFFRFLREVPEGHEDVDPEVFKRVPVPI